MIVRSMTGYGRGETDFNGAKLTVELNSVNRKQNDIVVNLPRDLVGLESRVRQTIGEGISRGRTNVVINCLNNLATTPKLALDTELARSYHQAMRELQNELNTPGEITIGTILQAPGVMRVPEQTLDADDVWPALERALRSALAELIKMREREGKHLAKDLIHRLKAMRKRLKEIRALHPDVVRKYRAALLERIQKADLPIDGSDERLLKEVSFFADRSDISEELTRLESHLAQFAHHLRRSEPVGRTLEFITQEIFRELNTIGAKANDAVISQHVVACKAELERIREQIQNLE
ncbi:MAG TPA: YicC/YloC family endoribonuclease [Chthoniobacterales bacterium]|nr:YicC/YloC family endoribonuclease [Chthoniobacterales bacterium]